MNNYALPLSKDNLDRLRNDPEFLFILPLARIHNALFFCDLPLRIETKAYSVDLNSLIFSCSLMYESLKVIKNIKKEFKDDVYFTNRFNRILKSKKNNTLETLLKKTRNKYGFHFDKEIMKIAIKNHNVEITNFLIGLDTHEEVYFGFVDELFINYLIYDPMLKETNKQLQTKYKQILNDIVYLKAELLTLLREVITDVLNKKGLQIVSI